MSGFLGTTCQLPHSSDEVHRVVIPLYGPSLCAYFWRLWSSPLIVNESNDTFVFCRSPFRMWFYSGSNHVTLSLLPSDLSWTWTLPNPGYWAGHSFGAWANTPGFLGQYFYLHNNIYIFTIIFKKEKSSKLDEWRNKFEEICAQFKSIW